MIERITVTRAKLLQGLESGALVLTGNARLSRSLQADYERSMRIAGREAWATPRVLPLPAWLQETWEEASLHSTAPLERLLSPEQEQALWVMAIGEDAGALLRPSATARSLAQSWQLLHEWRLSLDEPAFGFHEDAQAFRRWARRFAGFCQERSLVTGAELTRRLAPLLTRSLLPMPGQVVLVGFYELTPGQQELIEALAAAGAGVDWISLAGAPGRVCRVGARDPRHELQLAAQWARRRMQAMPGARVGIVVPDLAARRTALQRCLRQVLDPAASLPGAAGRQQPWNISLGEPLSAYPVIDTALNLLALAEREVPLETLGRLLASPWWAMPESPAEHAAEQSRRGLLDRRLRHWGEEHLDLGTVRFIAGQLDDEGAPQAWNNTRIGQRVAAMLKLRESMAARAGAAAWAHGFSAWLQAAGWRAGCALDSTAFQAVEKWQELLSRFSALDEFTSPMSHGAALALVRRLAGETVFQPQAGEAQLQVLGLIEANEQAFDHLWVMNLHDGSWPAALSPDPFIPLSLQREHGLPGCEPARELAQARRVTAQFTQAAGQVVLCYPLADGDERLQASPLIRAWPERPPDEVAGPCPRSLHDWVSAGAALQTLPAQEPVPLPETRARGGSGVLKHQAACPFRAFAEHRLGARPLDVVSPGLSPMQRGALMHKALELFWRETVSQEALRRMLPRALAERVEAVIAAAIEVRAQPLRRRPRQAGLEQQRLAGQIHDWLSLELKRPPFTVIGFEQEALLDIGGLQIRVVIDRVDQLEDGRLLIIDYKTGQVTPAGWFGPRPDDPQLPLYSAHAWEQPLAGVVFGVIRSGELKFNGVVGAAGVLPGLPPGRKGHLREAMDNWPGVLDDWRRTCEALAADYRSGQASVDPKNGPGTCKASYCSLAPLCRIPARQGAARV
jgi:probable DNA repair protein